MDVTDDLLKMSGIFMELASELRLRTLIRLNQQKLRQAELAKEFDATPQETHRNVDRLIETGLVVKDSEGLLSLTTFGKVVLEQIPDFAFLAEQKQYFEQHTLGDLPSRLIHNIGALYKGKLIHGVFNVEDKWKLIYHSANKYIHAVRSQGSLEMIAAVAEAIQRGIKYSYIFGQDYIAPKGRSALLQRLGWRDLMARKLVERRMADKVQVVAVLNERQASVCFPSLNDEEADLNNMFYSEDPLFHEWCLDYFRYKWDGSDMFDESKVKEKEM